MPYVEFYKTTETGQETLGRVLLDAEGQVRFRGLPERLVTILQRQVVGLRGQRFRPSDGLAYLNALCVEFSGSRLRASKVHYE